MPKSRHRKRTMIKSRREQMDRQATARRRIYELAFPEHQEYRPLQPLSRAAQRDLVIKVLAKANERRLRRSAKRLSDLNWQRRTAA